MYHLWSGFCFSVSSMDHCLRHFKTAARCSTVEAIECATLHPAQFLGISDHKGSLEFDSDADFVLLDPETLHVHATFIGGALVWSL